MRRAIAASLGCCTLLTLVHAKAGSAQVRPDPPLLHRVQATPVLSELPGNATRELRPGAAFFASAVLPGSGQYLLEADRWVPYVALEIWGWVSYIKHRNDARDLERRYRDLAWSVARRISVGARRDSIFEYYEDMSRFSESGAFDADPEEDGVQPEQDGSTFNGGVWQLARALFIPGGVPLPSEHPRYLEALAYYESHAIPPAFAWAWGDSNLEQQVFREIIHESDEAFRDATQMLGLIIANHVVSAVDALVLARLSSGESESRIRLRFGSSLERRPSGLRWTPSVRVVF